MQALATKTRSGSGWLLAAAGLSLVAAGGALFMFVKGGQLPGCGPGSACDAVQSTRWAWWGPVPVSALGILAYVVLLIACLLARSQPVRWAGALAANSALMVLGAAAWFTLLQVAVLGHVCQYCEAVHACGAVAAILALIGLDKASRPPLWGLGPALIAVGALVGGQQFLEPQLYRVTTVHPATTLATSVPATSQVATATATAPVTTVAVTPKVYPPRRVKLLDQKLELDPQEYPMLGEPDADHVIVELFDYTCPHCQHLHGLMQEAEKRYGHQLAVVCFPIPLNSACNPEVAYNDPRADNACTYARDGLAVWKADPRKFADFHHWMFTPRLPPSVEEARKHAEDLVGKEAFAAALTHEDVEGRLKVSIKVYGFLSKGSLPKLIVDDAVVTGELTTAQDLFNVLESKLQLTPPK